MLRYFASSARARPTACGTCPATIVQVGASLEYRLKHFNQDLTGWEEKNQVVTFRLVAVEKDAWYFDGLTVRRDGPDGMVGAVRIDSKDGPPREAVFRYRRVK
jgi:hypothetical protein